MAKLPCVSSADLIRVLERGGWVFRRQRRHGAAYVKVVDGETRVTIIPPGRRSIPWGTLLAILGPKQTCIGRKAFERMLQDL